MYSNKHLKLHHIASTTMVVHFCRIAQLYAEPYYIHPCLAQAESLAFFSVVCTGRKLAAPENPLDAPILLGWLGLDPDKLAGTSKWKRTPPRHDPQLRWSSHLLLQSVHGS